MNGGKLTVWLAFVFAFNILTARGGVPSLAALNGSTFVKITTTNSGLQFVDATVLANLLGQPVGAVESAIALGQFQLTTYGQPVTWLPASGGSNLLFYAEAFKNNYSTNNIYWLTSGTNGVVGPENGQAPAPTSAPIWYPASLFYEVYTYYVPGLPLGAEADPWMTYQLLAIPIAGYNTANYFANLDNLTQGTDRAAQLSVNLWGGVVGLNNVIQITVNTNNVLGQWSWVGLTPTNLSVTIPSAWLVSGRNKLAFTAEGSTGVQLYVNSLTLSWPRTFTAVNGLIDFTANGNSVVSVNGFTGTNINLLDVTNPKQPLLVTNVTIDQPSSAYRLSFAPASPAGHYVAWQSGAAAPAYTLALGYVAGFSASSNGADYIIVSPPSLLTSATNLAAYRQQTGLKTIIAPLDEVYNEFGYGFPTPHSIQALVATAWTNWAIAPHYLVLLGKGTYDFLNIRQETNLTPPLIVSVVTPPPYSDSGVFASDSLMSVATTNGLPDVAVGRLSGLTTNDINNLINKIKLYESTPPETHPQSLLIADATDTAGNFATNILQGYAVLTSPFENTLILSTNSSSTNYTSVLQSMILTNWFEGVDFINYAGEGAPDQFGGGGDGGYFSSANLTNNLITNCPRLPVVVAMTCISGQYSQPGAYCLGEYLVQPTNGGAIAYYGATGFSLSGEASEFNVRLCTYLQANAQLGLGDMIRQAMADHITQDLPSYPVWVYNLLGDPALHYRIVRNLLPLQITAMTPTSISWSGGLPPYQLQMTTNLAVPSAWQPLGAPLIGNSAAMPASAGPMGFFRVQGSQ